MPFFGLSDLNIDDRRVKCTAFLVINHLIVIVLFRHSKGCASYSEQTPEEIICCRLGPDIVNHTEGKKAEHTSSADAGKTLNL